MRTQEEIVKRFSDRKESDLLGFEIEEYIGYLNFEHAKPFLKKSVTDDKWEPYDIDKIKERMISYMDFAWDKAKNCRGISAGRSIMHYVAWLWLDGNDELAKTIEDYEYYGKPQLIEICDYLGIDATKWDDDVRVNTG